MNDEYHGYLTEAPVNHLCLCSGYDGVGRGLKRVFPNLRTVAYVEREGFPIANLVAKAEANKMDAAPVFTDVKTFPYDKFRGCVDVLSAGFPCQPFSSEGLRKATDDPRHLYPWIANGITACRPRLVLLENVEGIITAKTGDGESVLKYVLGDLEERGYRTSWCVASADEVGAPHQRKRVFIMGYATSEQSCRGSEDEGGQQSEVLGSGPQSDVFPARPNEQQYEWEEPRIVVNTADGEARRNSNLGKESGVSQHIGTGNDEREDSSTLFDDEIKRKLDGTTDGRTCRVDPIANRIHRLRLLGNGVVPATCERAVRILWNDLYGSARA
jgi:DNA (cytosine-5)-methyltransferase 1